MNSIKEEVTQSAIANGSNVLEKLTRSINHELRTPLTAIKIGVDAMKDYLPKLVEGYRSAQQQGIELPAIQDRHLEALANVLENIKCEANFSMHYLNMLSLNLQTIHTNSIRYKESTILSCFKKAIDQYPHRSQLEKDKLLQISWPNVDFKFSGDDLLIINVITNLIRNALYHIQGIGYGDIFLDVESKADINILLFKNSGKAIPEAISKNIFDYGFSTNSQHMGIGLSFCRQVMEAHGGSIHCNSTTEFLTEFRLLFPVINRD